MLLNLKKQRFGGLFRWSAIDFCDRLDEPGVSIDDPDFVDYSEMPPTIDQQRIERLLAGRDLSTARLLHVGVGDSGLAFRLQGHCRSIDGITVSERERVRAESRGIADYRVLRVNRYSLEFARRVQPGYDIIIDNNLASFACCCFHFAVLLHTYRWALAPRGEILTDQRGMNWVVGDRRWRMTFNDLAAAGRRFGLRAAKVTDSVYSLQRS
jgi:hypothetical protein